MKYEDLASLTHTSLLLQVPDINPLLKQVWILFPFNFFYLFCFSSQGFSVWPRLSWSSFCKPGWPQIQRPASFSRLNAGIKGTHHHTWFGYF